VIRRKGNNLVAIPYHEFFKKDFEDASKLLSGASRKLRTGPLSEYLREISNSLITGDYKKSDIAWVKTTGSPFEIVFGPIETYEDGFLGLKASLEAFIGIPDLDITRYLETFKRYIPEFDSIIAKRFNYVPKGSLAPMVVFSDVFRSGEAAAGSQFVAANLPNDREIHEKYGSKKVFSKTMMRTKSVQIVSKIAERILSGEDKKNYNHDARVLFVLGHEIAHGIGPGIIEKDGERVNLEKLLKETSLPLEEAKADTLGFTFLRYLERQGVVNESQLKEMILTDLVGNFVGWRMSFTEAHPQASLMEYNYLRARGAITYNPKQKTISIDYEKAFLGFEDLANEIMTIQNTGDYNQAKKFLNKWTEIPGEIKTLTDKLKDIPLQVYPIFNI